MIATNWFANVKYEFQRVGRLSKILRTILLPADRNVDFLSMNFHRHHPEQSTSIKI